MMKKKLCFGSALFVALMLGHALCVMSCGGETITVKIDDKTVFSGREGSTFTLPTPSARDGYEFIGYQDVRNATTYSAGDTITVFKASYTTERARDIYTTYLKTVWAEILFDNTVVLSSSKNYHAVLVCHNTGSNADISVDVSTTGSSGFKTYLMTKTQLDTFKTTPDSFTYTESRLSCDTTVKSFKNNDSVAGNYGTDNDKYFVVVGQNLVSNQDVKIKVTRN